ncbi:unnamed protein product [Bursaphelenchus xylophilus]|uniref:(pine wood nematode) hypothetical protein n=1 Tax=Bursaphelenchus xylophilus TaxID=6326 RepID=A0A1I7SMJ3_BURXY|nr:unnamed protein product [Bursaphelenchus xylophilus]CAG9130246.1 unnamed protein product [Bursaphelenchus xylophilus]
MPVDPDGQNGLLDVLKFYEDGNPEVKLLLENECNVLYECRVCQKVFRTIISLVSHKRTVCKDAFNNEELIEKNEFLNKLQAELKKSRDGKFEISSFCRQGRTNLLAVLAERREYLGTGTFGYPSKSIPLSTIQSGYQKIEHSSTSDKVVVVIPQDSSSSYGEMRLRKRRVDERYAELYPEQVDLLKKIPEEILAFADVNSLSCKSVRCKGMRSFDDFEILTYHLCLSHQPRNLETTPLCYFCEKKFTSFTRLKNHLKTYHGQIRIRHYDNRSRAPQRNKKRAERSSISPESLAISDTNEKLNAILDSMSEEVTPETSTNSSPVKPKLTKKLTPKKKIVKSPTKKVIESLDEQISVIVANAVSRSQQENIEEDEIDSQLNISSKKKKTAPKTFRSAFFDSSEATKRQPSMENDDSNDVPVTLIADYVLPKKFKPVNMDEDESYQSLQNSRESSLSKKSRAKPKKIPRAQSNPASDLPDLATLMKEEPVSDPASPVALSEFILPTTSSEANAGVPTHRHQKTMEVEFGRNDPFTGKPRSNLGSANNSPLKTFFPSALVGERQETDILNTPTKNQGEGVPSATKDTRGEAASRRKQNYAAIRDEGAGDDVKLIQVPGENPCRPDDLLSLPVMLSQNQRKMFFGPLKPLFSEKEAKQGRDGLHQCAECGQTCRNLAEGQKHMIGHIRAIRLKCSLCDVGAFFCADIRKHLMYRYCENIHLAPREMVQSGTPCMNAQTADKLIKIADPSNPGRAVYTSGKIITSESPIPYFPDPKIENILLGSVKPTMRPLSAKKISIVRKMNPHKSSQESRHPSTSGVTSSNMSAVEIHPSSPRQTTYSADSKSMSLAIATFPTNEIPMTLRLGRNTPIRPT